MISRARVQGFALVALLGSSCVGTDDTSLDVGAIDDPRYSALRERLSITLEAPAHPIGLSDACSVTLDAASPCCNMTFCSARGLATLISTGCSDSLTSRLPARSSAGACAAQIGQVELDVCVAQRLLEIVGSPGSQPIPARGASAELDGFTELAIGPQHPESNSELALEALRWLGLAQASAGDALAYTTSTSPPPVCSSADLNALAFTGTYATGAFATVTQVEELARFYREISILTEDATEHLIASGATVSDANFSTVADRAEAAALRNAPFASRLASAHGLVGGDSELPGLGA